MSEWVALYDTEAETVVYVNLEQASSIYPIDTGSEIWFLEHPGEPGLGWIRVRETPSDIFQLLRELPNAKRT
jgi:hypothetical protein